MSHKNRIKRFIYGLTAKSFNERFEDCIFVDECTVEIRKETWAGISRNGPTKLIIFNGNLKGPGYVKILRHGLLPVLNKFRRRTF